MERNNVEKQPKVLKFSVTLYNYDEDKSGLSQKSLPHMIAQDIFHNYHCDKVRVVNLNLPKSEEEAENEAEERGA